MELTELVINQYVADFILPFSRISALIMTMIGFGAKTIPGRIKLFLCLAVTVAVMPAIPPSKVIDLLSFNTAMLVGQQMIIGISLGFVTVMVVNTFTLAGQIIAMQSGLGFASLIDPASGMNVPAIGQFFLILSSLLFWAMDGHLAYLQFIVASFDTLPIPTEHLSAIKYREIVEWGSWMFATALSLALAPVTAMLLVNFAFGVMTRAAPQLNIFAVGFPIMIMVGLSFIILTLPTITGHLSRLITKAVELIQTHIVAI